MGESICNIAAHRVVVPFVRHPHAALKDLVVVEAGLSQGHGDRAYDVFRRNPYQFQIRRVRASAYQDVNLTAARANVRVAKNYASASVRRRRCCTRATFFFECAVSIAAFVPLVWLQGPDIVQIPWPRLSPKGRVTKHGKRAQGPNANTPSKQPRTVCFIESAGWAKSFVTFIHMTMLVLIDLCLPAFCGSSARSKASRSIAT